RRRRGHRDGATDLRVLSEHRPMAPLPPAGRYRYDVLTFWLAMALRVAAPKRLAPGMLALLMIAAGWVGAVSAAAPSPAEIRQALDGAQPGVGDGVRSGQPDLVGRGATLFATDFTPEQGLGPLYNA